MRSFDSFINDNAWQSLPYLPGRTVSCHLRLELIFILIISLIKQHVVVVAAIAVGAAVA